MLPTGWTLIEGRILGEHITRDPSIADVVAAIEAIHVDLKNPYVILDAPEMDGRSDGYCQALACSDSSYRCEIRLFGIDYDDYRHYHLMRTDEDGRVGTPDAVRPEWISGYYPDLATATQVFTRYSAKPAELPQIPGWQWLDMTEELEKESDEGY